MSILLKWKQSLVDRRFICSNFLRRFAVGRSFVAMNAIKKRLQTLKIEKDLAMDRADLCDQQAKEASRREEKLKDEVRELAKKLAQMERDLELSKAQLEKSNRDLEQKERVYIVVGDLQMYNVLFSRNTRC